MSDKVALVRLRAENAQYDAAMKKSRGETEALGVTAKKTGAGFGSMKSAMAGVVVGIGMSKVIGEYEQAQKVGRQTIAVIKSTGNAAQVSAKQQDDMVQSLSKIAAMDDEIIAQGANVLRTFTNIQGAETFEGALVAATDLSAAMGTDLQGSIVQVGKALNDPVKGLQGLGRAGVQFSAQQKEMVKSLVESGDTMGAQRIILDELTKQFGGAAAANATDSAKMKVAFDNAAESLGGSLAPALTAAAKGAEWLSTGFQKIPQPLQTAAIAGLALAYVGPKVVSGWKSAAEALGTARGAAGSLIERLGGVGGAAGAATPIVAGLGVAMFLYAEHEQLAAERSAEVASGIKTIRGEAERTGKSLEEAFTDTVLLEFLTKNGQMVHDSGVTFDEFRKGLTGSAADYDALGVKMIKVGGLNLGFMDKVGRLRKEMTGARTETKGHKEAVDALGIEEDGAAGSTAGLNDQIKEQAAASKGAKDAVADQVAGIHELFDARQASAAADQAASDAIEAESTARRTAAENNAAAAEQVRSAESQLADSRESAAKAAVEVSDAEADLARLRDEATGNSDAMRDATERYDAAVTNATKKDEDAARAVLELDRVRKGYAKTLAGLSDDKDDAAARNERQLIAIEEARKKVAEVNADPKASAADKRLAQLDYEQAIRDQRDTLDAAAAAQETFDRNQAAGAEGSDAYVAAADKVSVALADQTEAHKGVEEAATARADVQVAADAAVEAAEATLAGKIEAKNKAEAATVAAAGGVAEAHANVAKVAADGQKTIQEATEKATGAAVAAIWAHDLLWTKLGLSAEGAKLTATELRTLASTLGPNDPLRKYLIETAEALERIGHVFEVTIKVGVVDAGGAVISDAQAVLAAVFPARAKGGPIKRGHPYLVGEEGPELIVPDASGQVLTAAQTRALQPSNYEPNKGGPKTPEEMKAIQLAEAIRALEAATATHKAMGKKAYDEWLKALTNLFHRSPSALTKPAYNKGPRPVGAGNLPVTTDPTSMYADQHAFALQNSPIGMDPWRGAPAPTGGGGGGAGVDYDRLAEAIARNLPERITLNTTVDARGMSAGAASTLVGVELAERVRSGSTTGSR